MNRLYTWFFGVLLASLCACSADPAPDHVVRLDLKTDFVPAVEFDTIRMEFGEGDLVDPTDRLNRETDDFLRGQRIGSAGVSPGLCRSRSRFTARALRSSPGGCWLRSRLRSRR